MEQKTLIVACRETFFQNVPVSKIMEEMKRLTNKDREDLIQEFAKVGVEIISSTPGAPQPWVS